MDDTLTNCLEIKLKSLVHQYTELSQAHLKLSQDNALLMRENEKLLTNHKNAIAQIEAMVSHLKSIES